MKKIPTRTYPIGCESCSLKFYHIWTEFDNKYITDKNKYNTI